MSELSELSVTVTYLLFCPLVETSFHINLQLLLFFLLRDGRWLPLKALSTLRKIYQYSLKLYLSVCEFAYVWTCCMYPGCTVGTPDADSLWSITVLFQRENVSSHTYTYTYTSLLGNTASNQCGSSYNLWRMYVSEGGYHLAESCKPPLGNCFSFGPWIMPFGDSNPFCSQSLTHNWWVCVGWDRTAADFDACCHCSSPLVHLALEHPVSFQCSSISILTAESKLIMLTSLFKNVCKEKCTVFCSVIYSCSTQCAYVTCTPWDN